MKTYRLVYLILLLTAVLIASCGTDSERGTLEATTPTMVTTAAPLTPTTAVPPTPTTAPSKTKTSTTTATIAATATATMTVIDTPVPVTPTAIKIPYRVINIEDGDVLVVHSGPGDEHLIMGTIPPDGRDIYLQSEPVLVGHLEWVLITYQTMVGWVRTNFLIQQ
jgi:hypothetical protein